MSKIVKKYLETLEEQIDAWQLICDLPRWHFVQTPIYGTERERVIKIGCS